MKLATARTFPLAAAYALIQACGGSPGVEPLGGGPTDAVPAEGGRSADSGALDTTAEDAEDAGESAAPDGGAGDAGAGGEPPGGDTESPFPIDRGDDATTPGSYKGLPLRLTDNGEPLVTPVEGVIGLVCVGMSNANQECSDYIERASTSWRSEINAEVVIVNCAVGGHAIERWNDPAFDRTLWGDCIENKIPARGIRPDQVRVVYHKAADQFTTAEGGGALPPYPDAESDYFNFYDNLTTFADRVASMFPSVTAVYTTSRSYGGFAGSPTRGEPLSYEEGHALNTWLREHPSVGGVWHGLGPYIWAPDCASGETNGSGVCYERSDYRDDGIHPADGARRKVSEMIHARLSRHAWYRP